MTFYHCQKSKYNAPILSQTTFGSVKICKKAFWVKMISKVTRIFIEPKVFYTRICIKNGYCCLRLWLVFCTPGLI